uniref:Uncharacterized protein n=1 Tax=Aegilops tauschii subsp. strangulata TaxID=200361 RepID=A0A453FFW1_AEGTS
MTFLQLPRTLFLHPLRWHHGVMLLMSQPTSLLAGSFIQSERKPIAGHVPAAQDMQRCVTLVAMALTTGPR